MTIDFSGSLTSQAQRGFPSVRLQPLGHLSLFYVPNAFELLYTRLRGISGTRHAGSAYRGGPDQHGCLAVVVLLTKRPREDAGFRTLNLQGTTD